MTGKTHDEEETVEGLTGEVADLRRRMVALEASETERDATLRALGRANRALRALGDCSRAVIRARDESQLLQEVCRIIVRVGGYRLAWVGYAEEDAEKTVRPVAGAGFEDGYLETLDVSWAETERGRGPAGTAIRTGQPSIATDIQADPGAASSIALPLLAGEHTFGALNIHAAEPDAFDSEEVQLLTDLADNLAYGVQALRTQVERARAEEQLKASLHEKEVLLKEIHHRVKNNLQVVSSLLNLQARTLKDPQAVQAFQDSQNRVKAMALVHEELYRSQDLAKVGMAEYLESEIKYLCRAYGVSTAAVSLDVEVEEVFLPIDVAIPCGLIVHELVSNALKHAFPRRADLARAEVRVALYRMDEDQLTLVVRDNGVGLPPDLDWQDAPSLGLQLVRILSRQLRGALELERGAGTTFRLTFAEPAL